ncbi:hypothetical protein AAFF_G00256490 [Aldrovandia affinis]|uniref:Uncharacterized protein n=1 Tax=Aldrovandia affinis TaxID=143900 RepID=A0AAD7STC6_9TELE|nr:hypothetical protein AAFF_G00256490 [Aldrovandia affinis]
MPLDPGARGGVEDEGRPEPGAVTEPNRGRKRKLINSWQTVSQRGPRAFDFVYRHTRKGSSVEKKTILLALVTGGIIPSNYRYNQENNTSLITAKWHPSLEHRTCNYHPKFGSFPEGRGQATPPSLFDDRRCSAAPREETCDGAALSGPPCCVRGILASLGPLLLADWALHVDTTGAHRSTTAALTNTARHLAVSQ